MRLLAVAALLAASTFAYAQGEQDTRFTLVCQYGSDATGYRDINLAIDVTAQTVSNQPATITEGEIRWRGKTESTAYDTTINRYSGGMTVSATALDTNRTNVFHGSCAKPTTRKF